MGMPAYSEPDLTGKTLEEKIEATTNTETTPEKEGE